MTTQSQRKDLGFHDAYDVLERIWRVKSLPTDARFYLAGAIHQAGIRQGDEIIPVEIFQKMLLGQLLDKGELMDMMEAVHEFVFVKKKLRDQYVVVIIKMITDYFDRNLQYALDHLEPQTQRQMKALSRLHTSNPQLN